MAAAVLDTAVGAVYGDQCIVAMYWLIVWLLLCERLGVGVGVGLGTERNVYTHPSFNSVDRLALVWHAACCEAMLLAERPSKARTVTEESYLDNFHQCNVALASDYEVRRVYAD